MDALYNCIEIAAADKEWIDLRDQRVDDGFAAVNACEMRQLGGHRLLLFWWHDHKDVACKECAQGSGDGIFNALAQDKDQSDGEDAHKECRECGGSTYPLPADIAIC